jgi:hypothetical protein
MCRLRKEHGMPAKRHNGPALASVLSAVFFLIAALGCSSGGGNAVTPDLTGTADSTHSAGNSRVLWGMWSVSIDPDTLDAGLTPLRGAAFTANVTQFMQPPSSPTNLVSIAVDGASDPSTGYFVVDITLKHPFPGLNMYNGFDVRGVLYSGGSISGEHDSSVLRAGDGDAVLLNPDGCTRWWNWPEFTSYNTLFGATYGKLAPPVQPTSTVNGYKYFADGLGAEDPVASLDQEQRGFFSTSSSNTRRYEIQFKMNAGKPVFDFNYAVDASWSAPDPAYAPAYPPEAFPLSANCQEAFLVQVDDAGSTAFYEDPSSNGGELVLDIEVFDWQGGANGDVPGEIAGIYLEGDPLSGVVDVLSTATVLDGSSTNSSVFEVTIGSLNLTASGDFQLFGTVESADPTTYEPQIPGGGGAFDYPDAALAAYFTCTVNIKSESPNPNPIVTGIDPDEGIPDCTPEHVTVTGADFVDGATFRLEKTGEPDIDAENVIFVDENTLEGDLFLAGAESGLWDVTVENPGGPSGTLPGAFTILDAIYVDGDNTGMEDGTQDHPYNTIQEGVNAAYASNDEPIIVDQCAVDYSPFSLKNNSHVIGCNWNDGVGWPTVNQVNQTLYGNAVTNVTVEGLFFDITINSGENAVYFNGGNGIDIKGCKFSGIINTQYGYILRFEASQNVEVSYSEFTDIFQRAPDSYWRAYYVVTGNSVNYYAIHHCEFHHIGYDQPDAGAFGNSSIVVRVGYGTAPPHNCDFHNILAYDIFDKTDCIRPSPNPDPQNALTVFSLSNVNSFDWVGYFKLYNITVDDIRNADPPSTTIMNAGHCNGGYFGMVGGDPIVWKNNIVSNVEPTDENMWAGNSSYYGWWVDGAVQPPPSPRAMDYSDCYNIGVPLPNGANNWQWSSGFVNQVYAGTGSYQNYQNIDPVYDMTPGGTFYHPTNTLISQGADDGGEMGAFGGPDGDWIPPSQL